MYRKYCDYFITIDGKKERFSSDKELDLFLKTSYSNYEIDEVNKTFSTDLQASAKQILGDIRLDAKRKNDILINDNGDVIPEMKVNKSIGVTKFITTYGNPSDFSKPLITPFDLDQWRKNKFQELKTGNNSDEVAKQIISDTEASWKVMTDYGSEIHRIIEFAIKGEEVKDSTLSPELFKVVNKQVNDFVFKLKQIHGKKAEFYPEFSFKSKVINDDLKTIFNDDITSVNGRIDLLVLDENGQVHLYDFKTSTKEIGEWDYMKNIPNSPFWHSTKKLETMYQLTFYQEMLKQYGINISTVNVVPIKTSYEYEDNGITIKSLETVDLDFNKIETNMKGTKPGSSVLNNVRSVIKDTTGETINTTMVLKGMEKYAKMFPETLNKKIQSHEVTYEYYRYKKDRFIYDVQPGDKEYGKSKYKFFNQQTRKSVYAIDDNDLDNKIRSYVDLINETKTNELDYLGNQIELALQQRASAEELLMGNAKNAFIKTHFARYINNKWTFIRNTDLNSAGIFIFKKDGKCEIVGITNEELSTKVKLNYGTTLLGNHLDNMKAGHRNTLDANNGNLQIMKVLCFVEENSDLFEDVHINNIKSLNIWTRQYTENYNSIILDNFRKVCEFEKVSSKINQVKFNDDIPALLETARSYLDDIADLRVTDWKMSEDINTLAGKQKWLRDKIEEMYTRYGARLRNVESLGSKLDDPIWVAYMYLSRALVNSMGYNTFFEKNPPNYIGFSDNKLTLGSFLTSVQNAESRNLREVGRMMSLYRNKIRDEQVSYLSKYHKIFDDFYKEKNRIRIWGNEAQYFSDWFVKQDGKISNSFILKDPSDPSFGVKEKKAIETFLTIINDLRYDNNQLAIEEAKENGDYYKVPLMEAAFVRRLENQGVVKATKDSWKETLHQLDVLTEQVDEKRAFENENHTIYNKFRMNNDTRNELIDSRGVGYFETHLEIVLSKVVEQFIIEKVSNEFIPLLQGFKMALVAQEAFGGGDINGLLDFMDKYIKYNIYNEPIMEESLRAPYRVLSVFKQMTTFAGLGFNYVSGARELMQGLWIGASRTMSGIYGRDMFTSQNWLKATSIILKEAPKSIAKLNLIELMNWQYGMANAGASELGDEMMSNKLGVRNWTSSQLYWFSKAPDMLHRMSWLISKMINDGCWEAHSVSNDQLIYDFNKDKRFNLLVDSNSDKNTKAYKDQYALYLSMVEQFNTEGYNIDATKLESLPRAYTSREAMGIKNIADTCYGHYDKDTQLMAKNTFLGAFFFQFRTFVTAKLEQWLMKPGVYNTENLKQQYNQNGEKLVRRKVMNENDVYNEIIPESELREGDIWEYYFEWQGTPMEGIWWSITSYASAIRKLDGKELAKLWKDPLKRGNLYLFLHDMGLMMLLSLIIQVIFEWDDLKNKSWIARSSLVALVGSFQDGPVHNVVSGMLGDLNPPSLVSIKSMLNTAGEVIVGDVKIWDSMTQNIGALRQLHQVSSIW